MSVCEGGSVMGVEAAALDAVVLVVLLEAGAFFLAVLLVCAGRLRFLVVAAVCGEGAVVSRAAEGVAALLGDGGFSAGVAMVMEQGMCVVGVAPRE